MDPRSPAPLVSIAMPAYNVGRYVRQALESVLAQTHTHLEVVVVDDGSSDETPAVVQSLKDERLRYVRNPENLGGFQTMNRAIGLTTGEFVAVYHTDDVYYPQIVERELSFLLRHPEAGAVFCLDDFIDEEGRKYGAMELPREFTGNELITYEDTFPFLLRRRNHLFCCPTFMGRRQMFQEVGMFDAARWDIAADLDLWIRILRKYPVGVLNERLMAYRHFGAQWSRRYNYLRTDPELCFAILDHYLETDNWAARLGARDRVEYSFQRMDDATFRAANWIIRGNMTAALELLRQPFPWPTLWTDFRRRKLRALLLRWLMRTGIALGLHRRLKSFLEWSEYRGKM